MDIKAIAEQVMGFLGEAPEKIQEFIADPKGMIEQVTGQTLGEGDVAGVVEHIKEQFGEGGFDLGAIQEKVEGLFADGAPLNDISDFLGGIFKK